MPDPKEIKMNCPICMAELDTWDDVNQAFCPTCDQWVSEENYHAGLEDGDYDD